MKHGCAALGCDKPARCLGLCTKHYQRARRGVPLDQERGDARRKHARGQACSEPGCERQATSRGLCNLHDCRLRRHKRADVVRTEEQRRMHNRQAQRARKAPAAHTYPKFYGRHEHRVVMELHLGRKLGSHEIVHHRNGDKHDNRIENLELLDRKTHIAEHLPAMILARQERAAAKRAAADNECPF